MKVTAQWIAEQCGVSRGTVDRVVNGRPNVAPEVRERVQKMINEYGYKTPAQRQAARAGRGAYRIGVAWHHRRNPGPLPGGESPYKTDNHQHQ